MVCTGRLLLMLVCVCVCVCVCAHAAHIRTDTRGHSSLPPTLAQEQTGKGCASGR